MRKNILLLLTLLMLCASAVAGPRTAVQARLIAERQAALLGITPDRKSMAKANSADGIDGSQLQTADYYIFSNGAGKGYTIVSGDDLMPEIVGYADSGTLDTSDMPSGMAAFLADYSATLRAVRTGDKEALSLLAERAALHADATRAAVAVSPLLGNIKWNQLAPYNALCPKYDGTNLSATGCVATAMAQVMAYWKYPKTLQADIPQYTTGSYKVRMSGASKGEAYDWDNMLDTYGSNYTQAQANAVAKLMLHCGMAVQMDYGPESGANVTPARLATYFGYDADLMQDLSRSSFTLAEWTALIDSELKAGRPVLYGGQSSAGGHQYVCDGSDGQGLYHINWGWGGSQDGYFDITILNPAKGGTGSGNAPDGYNRSCSMIVGMQPDNGKVDTPPADVPTVVAYNFSSNGFASGIAVTQGTRSGSTDKLGLTVKEWWSNQTYTAFSGKVAYGLSDGQGGFTLVSTPRTVGLSAVAANGSASLSSMTTSIKYSFPVGTYSLYALYSPDGGSTWRKCAYVNMRPYVLKVTDTGLTLLDTRLTAAVSAVETLYSGAKGTVRLSVTNNGDDEFLGLIDVYTSATASKPGSASSSVYMTVPARTTVTRDVAVTPSAAGSMYVWVADDSGSTLVSARKFTVEQSVAPSFTLVGVSTNATEGAYERVNACYGDTKVELPRVNDDSAEFTFDIRNDGSLYTTNCIFWQYNLETGNGVGYINEVSFAGNGATTRVSFKVSPDDVDGSRSIGGSISILKSGSTDQADKMTIATSLPKVEYTLVENGEYCYRVEALTPWVYVAGKPDGIAGVESTAAYVRGGVGEIIVRTDQSGRVGIFGIDGRKVCDVCVEAGALNRVPARPGLYVVGGTKVLVR